MITLVDTSVWVDHLRHRSHQLAVLLEQDHVRCHPLIVGELACGNLSNRRAIVELLTAFRPLQWPNMRKCSPSSKLMTSLVKDWDGLMFICWHQRSLADVVC